MWFKGYQNFWVRGPVMCCSAIFSENVKKLIYANKNSFTSAICPTIKGYTFRGIESRVILNLKKKKIKKGLCCVVCKHSVIS